MHADIGDGVGVVGLDGRRDQLLWSGDQRNVPLLEDLECAVIKGSNALDGQLNFNVSLVGFDSDRAGCGAA